MQSESYLIVELELLVCISFPWCELEEMRGRYI